MTGYASLRAKVAVLAVAGITALAACGGSSTPAGHQTSGGFGSVPAQTGTPVAGGTVTMGMLPGATPNYIFPIPPSADTSVYTIRYFQNLMYRPLYWESVGTAPAVNLPLSLAAAPVWSNGNKTVTVSLDPGYKWSDGQPVVANDVIFFIDLLKAAVKESAANFGNYSPGYFPDNVASASAPGQYTVTLNLTRAYNPEWYYLDQLNQITPLPSTAWAKAAPNGGILDYANPANAKKIYDFLNAQSLNLATYAANPLWQVVDGPFRLHAFDASTDANTMVPNTAYTGASKPHIAQFQEVAFTSSSAEFDQLRSGGLTVGLIPSSDIPQVPTLQSAGYNVFGYPIFGWDYMVFNFKDTTGHWNSIVAQPYVRQALAHLVDQTGYIKGILHGAASPAFGTVPSLPASQFTPSDAVAPLYPYSVAATEKLLTDHGWTVTPNGTDTCARPGTGAGQCGAGIPAGTPLSFNLIYNSGSPAITGEDTAFASSAKQAGITVALTGKTFNFILQNYDNTAAPSNVNKWAMEDFGGFSEQDYPTANTIFNTSGSLNIGSYGSATADALIHNSVYGSDANAVKAEASFLTQDLPALFQPDNDHVYAWKKTLSGPPDTFSALTQFRLSPEQWYFTK
jgi:peptide/nickel transport system substrate-binding protein